MKLICNNFGLMCYQALQGLREICNKPVSADDFSKIIDNKLKRLHVIALVPF